MSSNGPIIVLQLQCKQQLPIHLAGALKWAEKGIFFYFLAPIYMVPVPAPQYPGPGTSSGTRDPGLSPGPADTPTVLKGALQNPFKLFFPEDKLDKWYQNSRIGNIGKGNMV